MGRAGRRGAPAETIFVQDPLRTAPQRARTERLMDDRRTTELKLNELFGARRPTAWVTRERPKIDRIACPWLIRRFIDPDARILYAPTQEVFATAQRESAIAFDIPGAPFSHVGDLCSFDAFIGQFGLGDEAGLATLAPIVRGADTDRHDPAPESSRVTVERAPDGAMISTSPARTAKVERSISMPRADACSTVVVVTHPASAGSRNSTGLAPSLRPSSTGGSPLVNSNPSWRDISSAPAP